MSVFVTSSINVIDNSGAIKAKCVEIYKSSKYYGGNIGDVILVSIQKVLPNRKIKKSDLIKAVVVRSKNRLWRGGGHALELTDNAVILLHNTTLLPRAKRCKTPLPEELRFRFINGLKILALAPVVL